jgi:hypothetical protein
MIGVSVTGLMNSRTWHFTKMHGLEPEGGFGVGGSDQSSCQNREAVQEYGLSQKFCGRVGAKQIK